MSKHKKIEKALAEKGISAIKIDYVRAAPTPSGYANGWEIDLNPLAMQKIWGVMDADQHMEFDTFKDVLEWISTLPNITPMSKP